MCFDVSQMMNLKHKNVITAKENDWSNIRIHGNEVRMKSHSSVGLLVLTMKFMNLHPCYIFPVFCVKVTFLLNCKVKLTAFENWCIFFQIQSYLKKKKRIFFNWGELHAMQISCGRFCDGPPILKDDAVQLRMSCSMSLIFGP